MATIEGVVGAQYLPGTAQYRENNEQYATSTHGEDHHMDPALIVQPSDKNDITLTLRYAKREGIAVAIRTGGHQYSGASSAGPPNIQLDLQMTFRNPDDRTVFEVGPKTFIRTSVSWSLGEFNKYLGSHHVFVPHGQCINVHLGGHVQTGGYGQLGRSFGLLGDHVTTLEIIDHEGNEREVSKNNNPELFFAFLGGSPGNLGVLTHFTIEVHRDSDHQGSRGLKALYLYEPKTLKRLLDIMVEMSDSEDFPRNYDYCVSVLSSSFHLPSLFDDVEDYMRDNNPEVFDEDLAVWPRSIIVYAQWVPFQQSDVCDMSWFDRIREGAILGRSVQQKPMSQLTAEWIFRKAREFDHPYVKSTYLTNSTTLGKDDWAGWVTNRIDTAIKPEGNRCWVSSQLQYFGGKHSKMTTNANNGTAYSWRDTTICATLDCFHTPESKGRAEEWEKVNNQEGIGSKGVFSKQDRRWLWGSYGNYDLNAVWNCYYEDRAKYERLQKARRAADPDGTFTPNPFCVKRA
jgi:hypothetical protein